MFLSPEKFVILIALTSGLPFLFTIFVAYLLYQQNNMRKRLELEVLNAMLTTQEDERKRIAQDLHDQIGPQLVGIKLMISFENVHLTTKQRTNIDLAKERINDTIKEIRSISHNLYSESVLKLGLTASLIEAVTSFADSGKEFTLDIHITEERLSEKFQINIYRIILELIANSIKHSSGNKICLTLKDEGNELVLDYSDNGKFSISDEQNIGIGLRNIQNRVQLLGGKTHSFSMRGSTENHYLFRFKLCGNIN